MSAAAAVRGVPGGWDTLWELASRAPGSSLGGRPRKAWLLGGPKASGSSTRESSWLWKEAVSSAGRRCGRPGQGPSLLGLGNSLEQRRLPGGRLLPSRARVALGLVSTHWCSAEGGLFRRQTKHQRRSQAMERPQNEPRAAWERAQPCRPQGSPSTVPRGYSVRVMNPQQPPSHLRSSTRQALPFFNTKLHVSPTWSCPGRAQHPASVCAPGDWH